MFRCVCALLFAVFCKLFTVSFVASSQNDDDVVGGYAGFNTLKAMPIARSDMGATLFHAGEVSSSSNARIYLVGGCTSDQYCYTDNGATICFCTEITASCDYFEPDDETWYSNCASAPTARYRHSSAKVNGKIYLAGGRNLNDSIITTIDIYNPKTNSWTSMDWGNNATSDGVAFGYGNSLYLVGGYDSIYNSVGRLDRYDTVTGTWDYSLPAMPSSRGDVQILEHFGEFYVFGGYHSFGYNTTSKSCSLPTTHVEAYNPQTKTWKAVTSMLYPRADCTVGIIGDELFVIGGESLSGDDPTCSSSEAVSTVTRYAISTDSWSTETSISFGRFRYTGASYNSTTTGLRAIYLFGGQKTFDKSCMCYRILNTTTLYVPTSTVIRHHHDGKLSDGGIAGVVIAAFVVSITVGVAFFIFMGRYTYLRYRQLGDINNAPPQKDVEMFGGTGPHLSL